MSFVYSPNWELVCEKLQREREAKQLTAHSSTQPHSPRPPPPACPLSFLVIARGKSLEVVGLLLSVQSMALIGVLLTPGCKIGKKQDFWCQLDRWPIEVTE